MKKKEKRWNLLIFLDLNTYSTSLEHNLNTNGQISYICNLNIPISIATAADHLLLQLSRVEVIQQSNQNKRVD